MVFCSFLYFVEWKRNIVCRLMYFWTSFAGEMENSPSIMWHVCLLCLSCFCAVFRAFRSVGRIEFIDANNTLDGEKQCNLERSPILIGDWTTQGKHMKIKHLFSLPGFPSYRKARGSSVPSFLFVSSGISFCFPWHFMVQQRPVLVEIVWIWGNLGLGNYGAFVHFCFVESLTEEAK